MPAKQAFEALALSLVGQPISYIWRGYGSAIFIEIGELTPRLNRDGSVGHPEGEVSLGVEWSWRIENTHAIVCGSWSDDDLWEPALSCLRDARVERCEALGYLPEVVLTTVEGFRFLTFSTTDGQPQWHIVDRRDGDARWFSVRDGQLHLGDGTEPAF
ncbi:hypothetical protein [Sphingobium yanoikuyae]|nr:hypothetical protein [Sphingobium yanoikuyae]